MNRHVKCVLVSATIATAVFALSAIGWRAHLVMVQEVALRPRPLAPAILLAIPLILAAVLIAAERHLAGYKPGISQDNPRHTQAALLFSYLFVAVCTAWMGLLYVERRPPGGEVLSRYAVVLLGMAMAVRGNFFAKLSPPLMEPPVDSAAWTRFARQMARVSVATGLTLIACAVGLPLGALFLACLVMAVLLVATNLILRRQAKFR
jgi:hypothetical protein